MAARKKTPPPAASQQASPERWLIQDLRPHPRQDEWFSALPERELRALAISIERDGLQHRLHVLPCGTILAGHQRLAAAQLLGWKEIDVIVRHDLADDEVAAAMFVITDNLRRRQMGPLEVAAAYKALREIELGQPLRRAGTCAIAWQCNSGGAADS